MKNYRHGEIALVGVKELPKDLELSNSKCIMVGSHGNSHTIDNGDLYFKKDGDFIFGYLVAKNTHLIHPEHKEKNGKSCKIADGIYQLIKQNEYTPEGLVPVID